MLRAGEAGTLRFLEKPNLQAKKGPSGSLRGLGAIEAPPEGTGGGGVEWVIWAGKGRFPGDFGVVLFVPSWEFAFSLPASGILGPLQRAPGRLELLVTLERGAKDSRVGLGWAFAREDAALGKVSVR